MEANNKFTHENDVQNEMKECSINQRSSKKFLKAAYWVLIKVTVILKTWLPLVVVSLLFKVILQ